MLSKLMLRRFDQPGLFLAEKRYLEVVEEYLFTGKCALKGAQGKELLETWLFVFIGLEISQHVEGMC